MTTINPSAIAQQLATAYVEPTQAMLRSQTKAVQASTSALQKLQSALQSFTSALNALSGRKSVLQYSASLNQTGLATATASSGAQPGTYSMFIEQLASAHQIAFRDLPAVPVASGGPLTVHLADGTSFHVDLTAADADGDGTLSQAEIARAVNQASGNAGKVNAMLVTVNGQSQLILASAATGAAGKITLDTSGLPAGELQDALAPGMETELSAARDAIVWLGEPGSNGIKMQQASNTFTGIPGVTLNITAAMAPGAAPLVLSVARDDSGTSSNVKSFVDAYNALNKVLDELTGTNANDKSKAPFANDAALRTLRSRLNNMLRDEVGGLRLADYGISANRYGVLSLNDTKLQDALTAKPEGLDALFGRTGLTTSSGIAGAMNSYIETWTSSTNGQIKQRRESLQRIQRGIDARQTRLDAQFDSTFERYLAQFSQLQALQARMQETSGLFAQLNSLIQQPR